MYQQNSSFKSVRSIVSLTRILVRREQFVKSELQKSSRQNQLFNFTTKSGRLRGWILGKTRLYHRSTSNTTSYLNQLAAIMSEDHDALLSKIGQLAGK